MMMREAENQAELVTLREPGMIADKTKSPRQNQWCLGSTISNIIFVQPGGHRS